MDAIFEQLAQVHAQAETDASILRLSLDAKATVLIGISRVSRVLCKRFCAIENLNWKTFFKANGELVQNTR
jgi:hypothetical protein